MKVSVCLIQPENYPHWQAFLEVAQLLCASFESLGHRCPLRMNWVEPGALNIVIGYHFLEPEHIASFSHAPFIFYQLEQLSANEGWLTADRERVLRAAPRIWDYSGENVAFLRAKGFSNVSHLPLVSRKNVATTAITMTFRTNAMRIAMRTGRSTTARPPPA